MARKLCAANVLRLADKFASFESYDRIIRGQEVNSTDDC